MLSKLSLIQNTKLWPSNALKRHLKHLFLQSIGSTRIKRSFMSSISELHKPHKVQNIISRFYSNASSNEIRKSPIVIYCEHKPGIGDSIIQASNSNNGKATEQKTNEKQIPKDFEATKADPLQATKSGFTATGDLPFQSVVSLQNPRSDATVYIFHDDVSEGTDQVRTSTKLSIDSIGGHLISNKGISSISYDNAAKLIEQKGDSSNVFPESHTIMIQNSTLNSSHSLLSLLKKPFDYIYRTIFWSVVPPGFPHTVSRDFGPFYKISFVQQVASTVLYVYSTTAVLEAAGIAGNAFGIATGVAFILKEAFGSVGTIFASKLLLDSLNCDANVMRTKFRADVCQNLGIALELASPLVPGAFLLIGASAQVVKACSGIISGACRAAINQRMAIANNLGDVTAKVSLQQFAAFFVGTMIGSFINTYSSTIDSFISSVLVSALGIAAPSVGIIHACFVVFIALVCASIQATCSYKSLRCLALPSINQARAHILSDFFISQNPIPRFEISPSPFIFPPEVIFPNPFDVQSSATEAIISRPVLEHGIQIELGSSVPSCMPLETFITYQYSPYLLHVSEDKTKINVVLASEASPQHMLKSFFHACAIRKVHESSKSNRLDSDALFRIKAYVDTMYSQFEYNLREKEWRLDQITLTPGLARADWGILHSPQPSL